MMKMEGNSSGLVPVMPGPATDALIVPGSQDVVVVPMVPGSATDALKVSGSQDMVVVQDRPDDMYFPHDFTRMGKYPTVLVYERRDWGAVPPTGSNPISKHPVNNVRFTDTGKGSQSCDGHDDCIDVLKYLQKEHMEKQHLPDIQYNFMIADDGTVYEGRGWFEDAYKPPKYHFLKDECIDIAYIGDWSAHCPPSKMLLSSYNWIMNGQDKKYVIDKPNIFQLDSVEVTEEMNKVLTRYNEEQ